MLEGIDVSRYQNPNSIDWQLAAKTIQFVYAKASEGGSSTPIADPRFSQHIAKAKEAGLLTGGYHYLRVRHGQPQDARQQADVFCDIIEKQGCELLPMLDCETDNNKAATDDEWLDAIRTFMARCRERLNVVPFLYTYPGFWASRRKLTEATDLAVYPLWIAHYTTALKPIVPRPWVMWIMWQYAAGAGNIGRVPGVPTVVDRNRLRVPFEEIMMHSARPRAADPAPIEPVTVPPSPEQTPVVQPEQPVPTSTTTVLDTESAAAAAGSITLPNTTPSGILGYILAFFRLILTLLQKQNK